MVGGALGTALAFVAAGLLSRFSIPGPEPLSVDVTADATVLLFGLGLAAVTGLVFGLAPGLQATRPDLVPALHSEGRGGRRTGRLRRWLVAGQVGASVVLLIAAGLFLRSLQRAGEVDAGFDPAGVRVTSVDLALDGYDEEAGALFQERLVERVDAAPGVEAAALALDLPLDLGSNGTPSWPEGWDDPDGRGLGTEFNVVSPGYFGALRVPVRRGRGFERSDGANAPLVVVINEAMADAVWADADPVGQRLRFGADDAPLRTVVGVVADVKNQTLAEVVDPMVYLPTTQRYTPSLYVVARGAGVGPGVGVTPAALRAAILEADPRLSIGAIQRLEEVAGLGMLPQRIAAALATALGALALLLSVLGVYGVVAHSVTSRRREVGVRMAIGATRSSVIGLVLRGGARLVLPGVVAGALVALAVGRVIRGFLFGVSPTDAVTIAAALLVMAAAVALASGIPALRASRLDPMEALRSE